MPLLDGADDVDGEGPVAGQRGGPVLGDAGAEGEVAGDGADHHLAHGVVLLRVLVHVLHPPQRRVGRVALVEDAHRLHARLARARHLQPLRQQVQVEQGADGALVVRLRQLVRVQEAEQHLEGRRLLVVEPVGRVLGVLGVEVPAEHGRVVAEQLLVHRVRVAVRADVNVDERAREQPVGHARSAKGAGSGRRGVKGSALVDRLLDLLLLRQLVELGHLGLVDGVDVQIGGRHAVCAGFDGRAVAGSRVAAWRDDVTAVESRARGSSRHGDSKGDGKEFKKLKQTAAS